MKRAFSALELIIVLVIIAVLAIMLVPALEEGRKQATRAKCMARMRQIGMAFEMYQGSHGGRWPSARVSVDPEHPEWPDPTASLAVLYPSYAPKTHLFQCPATEDVVNLNAEGTDFLYCENYYVSPSGDSPRPQDQGKRPPSPPSYFYDAGGPRNPRIPRRAVPARVVYGDECVNGFGENDAGDFFWLGENNHPMGGGNFLCADKRVVWLDVEWTGKPYARRRSMPYVPNTQMLAALPPGAPPGFIASQDTNVFRDDSGGGNPAVDADLAGMMWTGERWVEF